MRIRKNAKVSPILFASHASAEEDLQPHVCQLNQNPWDVISFGPDSNQWEAEESFYGGSFGDSIGAGESVASMMDSEHKAAEMVEEMEDREPAAAENGSNSKELENDKEEEGGGGRRSSSLICQKNDGKGWRCKKRAKHGQSYCNHHLSLLRFHHNTNNKSNGNGRDSNGNIVSNNKALAAVSQVLAAAARRSRAKAKRGSSSNPNEFYYYCGFGPRWGRNRGKNEKEEIKVGEDRVTSTTTSSTPPPTHHTTSQIDNKEIDYVDDDYDDEDDYEDGGSGGDTGRKRTRKLVKARSLKSLM